MDRPYTDIVKTEEDVLRLFEDTIDPEDLLWHRDNEDRIVEVIGDTDWMVQMDNELPKPFKDKIFIPKGVWHRAIKGTGALAIKIHKS
jgi:hypothetical protein